MMAEVRKFGSVRDGEIVPSSDAKCVETRRKRKLGEQMLVALIRLELKRNWATVEFNIEDVRAQAERWLKLEGDWIAVVKKDFENHFGGGATELDVYVGIARADMIQLKFGPIGRE